MSDPMNQPPPLDYAGTTGGLAGKDERMWAMLCHVVALAGFVVPFGSIVGPLVIWLIKKEEFPLVEDQGKESVNFQISMFIYMVISALLMLVFIGFLLVLALLVFDVIVVVLATVKANQGQAYRYPLCIRFIK